MEAARCAAKSSSENLSAASSPNFDVDFFRFRIFSISVGDSEVGGVDVKTPPTPPTSTSTISSKDFDADAEDDFDAVDFKIPFLGGNEVGRGVGGVKDAFAGGDQSGGANLDGVDGVDGGVDGGVIDVVVIIGVGEGVFEGVIEGIAGVIQGEVDGVFGESLEGDAVGAVVDGRIVVEGAVEGVVVGITKGVIVVVDVDGRIVVKGVVEEVAGCDWDIDAVVFAFTLESFPLSSRLLDGPFPKNRVLLFVSLPSSLPPPPSPPPPPPLSPPPPTSASPSSSLTLTILSILALSGFKKGFCPPTIMESAKEDGAALSRTRFASRLGSIRSIFN